MTGQTFERCWKEETSISWKEETSISTTNSLITDKTSIELSFGKSRFRVVGNISATAIGPPGGNEHVALFLVHHRLAPNSTLEHRMHVRVLQGKLDERRLEPPLTKRIEPEHINRLSQQGGRSIRRPLGAKQPHKQQLRNHHTRHDPPLHVGPEGGPALVLLVVNIDYLVPEHQVREGEEDYNEREEDRGDDRVDEAKEEIKLESRLVGREVEAPGIHGLFPILVGLDEEGVFEVEEDQGD